MRKPPTATMILIWGVAVLMAACGEDSKRAPSSATSSRPGRPGADRIIGTPGANVAAAVDLSTGDVNWTVPVAADLATISGMVIADDRLVATAANCRGEIGAIAINLASGDVLWKTGPLTSGETVNERTGELITAESGIYVVAGAGGRDQPPEIVGVDIATGEQQWSVTLPAKAVAGTLSGPTLAYAEENSLTGLDRVTGMQLWQVTSPVATSRPVLRSDSDHVYVSAPGAKTSGSVGGTFALDAATGATRWTSPNGPALTADHGVVTVLVDDQLVGPDAGTGKTIWSVPSVALLGDRQMSGGGRLAVADLGGAGTAGGREVPALIDANGKVTDLTAYTDVFAVREGGVLAYRGLIDDIQRDVLDPATGEKISGTYSLAPEEDQVSIPPEFGVDDHIEYLGRGCPGRR